MLRETLSRSNASAKCEPMNPAPPVSKMRFGFPATRSSPSAYNTNGSEYQQFPSGACFSLWRFDPKSHHPHKLKHAPPSLAMISITTSNVTVSRRDVDSPNVPTFEMRMTLELERRPKRQAALRE